MKQFSNSPRPNPLKALAAHDLRVGEEFSQGQRALRRGLGMFEQDRVAKQQGWQRGLKGNPEWKAVGHDCYIKITR